MQTEEFFLEPFSHRLNVENVVINNPSDTFPDPDFLKVRKLVVEAHPLNLKPQETIVIDELIIDIELLAYVQNTNNQINFDVFTAPFRKEKDNTEEPGLPAFLVRRLVIRLDTIKKVDYTSGSLRVQNFSLNIDREYKDVHNLSAVLQPLIKDLESQGASFVIDALARALMDPEAYQRLSERGKGGFGEKAAEGFKEVTELIKAVLESLKKE